MVERHQIGHLLLGIWRTFMAYTQDMFFKPLLNFCLCLIQSWLRVGYGWALVWVGPTTYFEFLIQMRFLILKMLIFMKGNFVILVFGIPFFFLRCLTA